MFQALGNTVPVADQQRDAPDHVRGAGALAVARPGFQIEHMWTLSVARWSCRRSSACCCCGGSSVAGLDRANRRCRRLPRAPDLEVRIQSEIRVRLHFQTWRLSSFRRPEEMESDPYFTRFSPAVMAKGRRFSGGGNAHVENAVNAQGGL